MLLRTRYRKLLDFAFIPHNILNAIKIRDNAVGSQLMAYLCYAFERAQPENLTIEDSRAIFAPGLQNTHGRELYCCFEPNKNEKQPWALVRIDTAAAIRRRDPAIILPKPVNALSDFNASLYNFAYIQRPKFEAIAPYFGNDVDRASLYMMHVFYWANKYGYIVYENDRVLLHTGLRDSADGIYALFGRNPQKMQPWTLMEFAPARLIGNVERLPDYVLEPAMPENWPKLEMDLPEAAWDTLVPIANATIAANG